MRLFFSNNRKNNHFILKGDEFRHSTKVLRQKVGDLIHIIDGSGTIYECLIETILREDLYANINTSIKGIALPYRLTLAVAPTKQSSRFEWFLEKAVEIGIHSIIPVLCKRSEKPRVNHSRMEKIVISAMKQSKNPWMPHIHPLTSLDKIDFSEWPKQSRFVGFVEENNKILSQEIKDHNLIVAIGPEGGFTTQEISILKDNHFIPVSLGESRLRTETAGVATCQIVKTVFDFLKY